MRLKVTAEEGETTLHDVGVGPLVVGREEESDLVLADPMVSGRHARLTVLPDGRVELCDLGSTNGIFVDGKRIRAAVLLVGGEEIRLGGTLLSVQAPDMGTAALAPEVKEQAPGETTELGLAPEPTFPLALAEAGAERRVEARGENFTIGRDKECNLTLVHSSVSHWHASLRVLSGGRAELRDLQSRNGTFVDGRRIVGSVVLSGGEEVQLGDMKISAGSAGTDQTGGRRLVSGIISRSPRRTMLIGAVLVAALLLSVWALTRGADLQELERATVRIQRYADGEPPAIGSGTIIREDGLILTNAHVADPAAPGLALLYGRQEVRAAENLVVSLFVGDEDEPAEPTYRARIVALDGYLDVAVLQIDATHDGARIDPATLDLPTVALGDSDRLEIDDKLRVIGYPGAGGETITSDRGIVSGFESDDRINGQRGWIKTSAPILGGNSGGLAADERGNLIGIPTKVTNDIDESGDVSGGQGKIRPINLVQPVIEAAKAGEEWPSRYLVEGTGEEKFTALGWAKVMPAEEDCPSYTEGARFDPGATALVAIFRPSGMSTDEDLRFVWRYQGDAGSEPEQRDILVRSIWEKDWGSTSNCFKVPLPGAIVDEDGALPDGMYAVEVRAGPSLRFVGRAETSIGVTPTESGNTE